jgi:hypothetical protein
LWSLPQMKCVHKKRNWHICAECVADRRRSASRRHRAVALRRRCAVHVASRWLIDGATTLLTTCWIENPRFIYPLRPIELLERPTKCTKQDLVRRFLETITAISQSHSASFCGRTDVALERQSFTALATKHHYRSYDARAFQQG